MESIYLIYEITTVLEEANETISQNQTDIISSLLEKIERRLRVIKAERRGLMLVESE